MTIKDAPRVVVLALAFTLSPLHAASPPGVLNHQGRIAVSGTNYSGTGYFKFALVNAAGTATFWSNDGTSINGAAPTAAVAVNVSQGHYALGLGDTTVANMVAEIPPSVFTGNADVRLRVWFAADGTNFEQLTPDRRITAAGYALSAGAVADPSFIGTTTNTPLDFSVNNQRGLRLQASPTLGNPVPNLIGGHPDNFIDATLAGSVIGGGGAPGVGFRNSITGLGFLSVIGGGLANVSVEENTFIGGGQSNQTSGRSSVVVGGFSNLASGESTFIGGGASNRTSGNLASVVGGVANVASGVFSTVGGGRGNTASFDSATVPGGRDNTASGEFSFAAGHRAKAVSSGAFVWADLQMADFSSTAPNQFLIRAAGGVGINKNNPGVALDVNGTVRATSFQGMGAPLLFSTTDNQPLDFWVNNVRGLRIQPSSNTTPTNPNPLENTIPNTPNLIAGHAENTISAGSFGSVIGGGGFNGNANSITNDASGATIAGGYGNYVNANTASIGGGESNGATQVAATVSGGAANIASGLGSTVPGGFSNTASGSTSFAAGYRAKAIHNGAFVWADSQEADFSSTGDNQFLIRAAGGVGVTGSQTITGSLRVDSLGTNNAGIFNDNALTFGLTGSREGIASKRTPGGNQFGLDFYTNNIAQLAIKNGGQVGVGTSDPSHKLTVSNTTDEETMRLIGAGTFGLGARLNFGDQDFVYLSEPFDDAMTIQANEVGVGGNPVDGGAKLQVTGGVVITEFLDQLAANDSRGALTIGSVAGSSIGFDNNDMQGYASQNVTGPLFVNRFGGNVEIGSAGATVTVRGTFTNLSDRNVKRDIQPVEPEAILDRLRKMPIATWQYEGAADRRHIGPMAQDFHAAFDDLLDLHSDDKTIAPLDEAGVAFASIQALHEKVEIENRKLQDENAALKERLSRLERAVESLARPSVATKTEDNTALR